MASASMLTRTRIALPTLTRHITLPSTRSVTPLKTLPGTLRLYSTEAEAETEAQPEVTETELAEESVEQEDAIAQPGEALLFKDLARQGVHPNLLDAIVYDMKYDSMTPVQAKTITPALKGTDM